jgi:hypothetical protein
MGLKSLPLTFFPFQILFYSSLTSERALSVAQNNKALPAKSRKGFDFCRSKKKKTNLIHL